MRSEMALPSPSYQPTTIRIVGYPYLPPKHHHHLPALQQPRNHAAMTKPLDAPQLKVVRETEESQTLPVMRHESALLGALTMILSFVISASISAAVSIVSKDVELGIETMATIAAWIACLEGALFLTTTGQKPLQQGVGHDDPVHCRA